MTESKRWCLGNSKIRDRIYSKLRSIRHVVYEIEKEGGVKNCEIVRTEEYKQNMPPLFCFKSFYS